MTAPCTDCAVPMLPALGGGRPYQSAPAGMRHHRGHGLCSACYVRAARGSHREPDWAAVARATEGERVPLTPTERRAAVAALTARRCSAAEIGRRLGIAQRSVFRIRSQRRERAAA